MRISDDMIFPKALKPGACVGLLAPSSPITREERILCEKKLREMGYCVLTGETLKRDEKLHGYLAGDAQSRAADINHMFADAEVDAIFCVRGGYGSSQLLKYLDYGCIRRNPKIFIGYSDITSLHTAFQKYCNLVTFHGPMVLPDLAAGKDMDLEEAADSATVDEAGKVKADAVYTIKGLYAACNIEKSMIFENPPGQELRVINEGCGEGRLAGGNLSVLARSLGTAFSPATEGSILFLEDVGESVPRLDMYLTQMQYAGIFTGVKGILLGDFTECSNEKYDKKLDVDTFLKQWFQKLKIPVLANVCSDHRKPMGTLPLGAFCRMRAVEKKISLTFYSQ